MSVVGRALVVARTLLIGAAGGGLFAALGLPAPWLSGAMMAVAAAALSGVAVAMPAVLRTAVFLLLGITMGAAVSPEVAARMADWPWSLAGLALVVPAIMVVLYGVYRRFARADRATAFLAATPGSLSFVLSVAVEARADVRQVALIHSIRLFVLVAVLPLAISAVPHGPAAAAPALPQDWTGTGVLVLAAVAGAAVLRAIRMPSAPLIGALATSALLHGTGLVLAVPPEPVVVGAFVVLGCLTGARFAGTGWRAILEVLPAAFGGTLIAFAIACAFAAAAAGLVGLPFGRVVLAYAPGGVEAMAFIAMALSLDPTFVGAHHIARMLGTAFLLPLVFRRLFPSAAEA